MSYYKNSKGSVRGDKSMCQGEGNKVLSVIHNLLQAQSVPESTNVALDTMCQLYHFDRVRSFIRVIGTDKFVGLDEANYGEASCVHIEENDVDFEQSYYRKDGEESYDMMHILIKEKFIHTLEFEKYQKSLEVIGFLPSKEKVAEACLRCVISREIGMMGYFVFEKFEGSTLMTEAELVEIQDLCEITNDRIETFETRKQLIDEEMSHVIDQLTGLPLIGTFKEEIDALLPLQEQYAMLYMDIDKFKFINEMWSRDTGNDILVQVASVIQNHMGETDKCCRITDDRFSLFFRCEDEEGMLQYIKELSQKFVAMQQKYFSEIKITVIGGAYFIREDRNINLIMDKANIARRSSKGTFENTFVVYNEDLDHLAEREKRLEKRIVAAIENQEFIPFLQPKFNLFTNEICGAEALARWKTEDRLISPIEFIPIFEQNGFVTKLDFIIYERVFQFIQECREKGYKQYPISLNVSRGHMRDEHFMEKFTALMDKYNVPYDSIELEITESIFMEDKEVLKQFIMNIRSQKISVSIDDFGTAYSSLNLLKDIVVDVIKMDKNFIDSICRKDALEVIEKDKIIIKNILTMINELQYQTIFEGIEVQEQVDFLKEIGCHYGQGFIFAKPMELEEFQKTYLLP